MAIDTSSVPDPNLLTRCQMSDVVPGTARWRCLRGSGSSEVRFEEIGEQGERTIEPVWQCGREWGEVNRAWSEPGSPCAPSHHPTSRRHLSLRPRSGVGRQWCADQPPPSWPNLCRRSSRAHGRRTDESEHGGFGQIGRNNSVFAKTYRGRRAVFGRRAWVVDPTGEYGPLARPWVLNR
jgi:hypothetical protein